MKLHNNILPKNWRQQVAKILTTQGLEVNEQQVYDAWRGKTTDAELIAKVKKARQRVANRHTQNLARISALRAVFFIAFWLF